MTIVTQHQLIYLPPKHIIPPLPRRKAFNVSGPSDLSLTQKTVSGTAAHKKSKKNLPKPTKRTVRVSRENYFTMGNGDPRLKLSPILFPPLVAYPQHLIFVYLALNMALILSAAGWIVKELFVDFLCGFEIATWPTNDTHFCGYF
jgi:hypothetical protein